MAFQIREFSMDEGRGDEKFTLSQEENSTLWIFQM